MTSALLVGHGCGWLLLDRPGGNFRPVQFVNRRPHQGIDHQRGAVDHQPIAKDQRLQVAKRERVDDAARHGPANE